MLLFAFCLSTNEGKEGKYERFVSTRLQRAHLLCLCLNSSENSCTCTRVCFCSSCEFSALESTRPRRYQQMYIDSTTYGEGHFDKYGSQNPRVV